MKTQKRARDRVSAEPWEVERLHREFPVKATKELEEAAEVCKTEPAERQDRERLSRCVQRKLSK